MRCSTADPRDALLLNTGGVGPSSELRSYLVPNTVEPESAAFVAGPLTVAASEQLQRLGGAVADVAAAPDHCPQLASR